MNIERPTCARTESMKRAQCEPILPPTQAGISAALRKAFAPPINGAPCDFDELLRKLD
jgi:hypothetical protein